MALTTIGAIRDKMIATVKGLTPTRLANVKYTAYDQQSDFRNFCAENPEAIFRRFSVRDQGITGQPTVSNTTEEWVEEVIECVIGYPNDYRYGKGMILDMDDAMKEDSKQIAKAIGLYGYAALDTSTGGDATILSQDVTREHADAVSFNVITLHVGYWRAP